MMKNFPKDSLFFSLFLAFLLLPLAQVKIVFFGIPLYLPEIALSIAGGLFLRQYFLDFQSITSHVFSDKWTIIGATLFFLGAVLSFIANPYSLTGLGMIKSWFFFPLLGAILVFFEAQNETKRNWFIVAWGLGLLATALGSLPFVFFGVMTYDQRLSGMYASPNFLSSFLTPVLFFLTILFSRNDIKVSARVTITSIAFILVASILYFTRSYGVWLAILVSFTIFLFMQPIQPFFDTKRNWFIGSAVFLIFAGFFLLEAPSDKWQALVSLEERSSFASRLMIWQSAERILQDHWFFGIGVGRFQTMYLEYQRFFPPYLEWAVPEPHNLYAAVLLSTGITGFLGFCLLVGRFLFLGIQFLFLTRNKEKRQMALILLCVFIFFLIYGIVDTPYFKNDLALSFWFLVALGHALFSQLVFREKE